MMMWIVMMLIPRDVTQPLLSTLMVLVVERVTYLVVLRVLVEVVISWKVIVVPMIVRIPILSLLLVELKVLASGQVQLFSVLQEVFLVLVMIPWEVILIPMIVRVSILSFFVMTLERLPVELVSLMLV